MSYIMDHEYHMQVATEGGFDGVGGGQGRVAALLPPVQPEDLHSAATVRLPGPEGLCRPVRGDRAGEGTPFHDAAEGVAPAPVPTHGRGLGSGHTARRFGS